MQPEGDELKQKVSRPKASIAVMMVTMQAGKCYTIVGYISAPGGVADVDLNIARAAALHMTLAGQDLTHNNTPTIGSGAGMCPVIAYPLQYKLDVFARKGTGVVVVQMFSKPKK